MPELPWEKRERYQRLGLKDEDIEYMVSVPYRGVFFDAVLDLIDVSSVQLAGNYVTSDLAKNEVEGERLFGNITPASFARVIAMITENKISSRGAKDILAVLVARGGDADAIAHEQGLFQVSDTAELTKIVAGILQENSGVVEEFKGGKEGVLQFLVGAGMKATKGSANPGVLKEIILAEIAK